MFRLIVLIFLISCSQNQQGEIPSSAKQIESRQSSHNSFQNMFKQYSNSYNNFKSLFKPTSVNYKDDELEVLKQVYQEYKPDKCFNKNNKKYLVKKKECFDLATRCSSFGFDSDREKLYVNFLNENLEIEKIRFYSHRDISIRNDRFLPKENDLDDSITALLFNFCGAAHSGGFHIETGIKPTFSLAKSIMDESQKSSEEFFVKCASDLEKLSKTQSKYNINEDSFNAIELIHRYKMGCKELSNTYCSNSRVVRDQLIYTYQTTSCETREVTAQDIDNDIREWKENSYVTNASIIKHELLRDRIIACEKAHKLFNIPYENIKIDKKICEDN